MASNRMFLSGIAGTLFTATLFTATFIADVKLVFSPSTQSNMRGEA